MTTPNITTCPVEGCGEELQGTVRVYTSGVVIRRRPDASRGIEIVDTGSRAFDDDGEIESLYCANDHTEAQIEAALTGEAT